MVRLSFALRSLIALLLAVVLLAPDCGVFVRIVRSGQQGENRVEKENQK